VNIKQRLEMILESFGDIEAEVEYTPMIIRCAKGPKGNTETFNDYIIFISKKKGNKNLGNVEEGSREWNEVIAKYKMEWGIEDGK